jgi:hypothetical protein
MRGQRCCSNMGGSFSVQTFGVRPDGLETGAIRARG